MTAPIFGNTNDKLQDEVFRLNKRIEQFSRHDSAGDPELQKQLDEYKKVIAQLLETPGMGVQLTKSSSLDPLTDIPLEISTEGDRVLFMKTVAQYLAIRAHIKVNTRKLYSADGHAVKEIMKIVSVLYNAATVDLDSNEVVTVQQDMRTKLERLKTCRTLASAIAEKGATLYNLLEKESDLKEMRAATLSRPFDFVSLQTAVSDNLQQSHLQLHQMKTQLEQVGGDESNLRSKIQKKKQELDRVEKRIKSLQSVRPAFMDEYERIEQELQQWYQVYVERFRNLSSLEQQLEDFYRIEQEHFQETEDNMRKMQNKLREEELQLLRDVIPSMDLNESEDSKTAGSIQESRPHPRPSAAAGRRPIGKRTDSIGGKGTNLSDASDDDFADTNDVGGEKLHDPDVYPEDNGSLSVSDAEDQDF
ncbi:Clusterin-associated protein 1 [Gonapodya sp. JEL0774]|nr:Clusterin-associated protein 1 [Gonapodya sp. JEL0774]